MSEGQWNEGQWKRWDVVSRLRAGKLTMAQAALAQGSSRWARAEIVKAIRSLKKFTARLRSRRAKRLIPDDVRSDLRAKSGEVRQEMVALKGQNIVRLRLDPGNA